VNDKLALSHGGGQLDDGHTTAAGLQHMLHQPGQAPEKRLRSVEAGIDGEERHTFGPDSGQSRAHLARTGRRGPKREGDRWLERPAILTLKRSRQLTFAEGCDKSPGTQLGQAGRGVLCAAKVQHLDLRWCDLHHRRARGWPRGEKLNLNAAFTAVRAGARCIGQIEKPLGRLLAPSVPPHHLLREAGLVGHGQDAVLLLPAHESVGADLESLRTQHQLGIPRAKWAQPREVVDQIQRELAEWKQGIDDEAVWLWDASHLSCHMRGERRAEGGDLQGIDGETRSHRVAAEAKQQLPASGDCRGDVDAFHRARRSPSHDPGAHI